MNNLKLKSVSNFSDPLLENLKFICENLNENYFFAINGLNQLVTIKNRQINLILDLNDLIDEINQTSDKDVDFILNNDLIAFGHLPDLELLCLIYSNGSIYSLNTVNLEREQKRLDKIELGYRLVVADFSPEYDKIVLATETDQLILLNSFFEEISSGDLNDQKQGAVDHLNVGWGKKETQFHGSEGKQSRTITKKVNFLISNEQMMS